MSVSLRLVLGGLVSVALMSACATPPPTPVTLTIAYNLWPGYYPLFIAQANGFFAEQGVTVNLVRNDSVNSLLANFGGGTYDGLCIAIGDVINLTEETTAFQVVLAVDESAGADMFLVSEAVQRVADLRGRRIGANLGGFSELFIARYLTHNGISPSEVTWVNAGADEVPQLLADGYISGGHTWDPYATTAQAQGAHLLFSSAETPGLIPDVVVFKNTTLLHHPEAVQGFVNAWFAAVDYWQANPSAGNQIVAQAVGLPLTEVSLAGVKLLDRADNQARFVAEAPEALPAVAALYVDFYLADGSLSKAPDLPALFNPTFVQPP